VGGNVSPDMSEVERLPENGGEDGEAAFQLLVERYGPMVRRVAWRVLRDDALADDVAQMVFVRFHEARNQLATHPEPGGWLHETARNVALQRRRSDVRRSERERQFVDALNSGPESVPDPFTVVDEAMAQLSAAERELLLARFFEGWRLRELSQSTGISEDAVRMRISRALSRLREELERLGLALGAEQAVELASRWGVDSGGRGEPPMEVLLKPTVTTPVSAWSISKATLIMVGCLGLTLGVWMALRPLFLPQPTAPLASNPAMAVPNVAVNGSVAVSVQSPLTEAAGSPSGASQTVQPSIGATASPEPEASIQRAREMMSRREFENARDLLIEVTRRFPASEPAWFHLGNAHESLGHLENALEDFNQALAAKPVSARTWHGRARIDDMLRRYEDGIRDCDEAIRLEPLFWPAHLVRGRCQYALQRYLEAIATLEEVIRLQPDWGETYDFVAWSHEKLGDYDAALATRKRYYDHKPDDSKANYQLARSLYWIGRNAESIPFFDRTIELDPLGPQAWRLRGVAKKRLGRWRDAAADFTEHLRMEPATAWSYRNRALCHTRLGEWERALRDVELALRQNANTADFIARRIGLLTVMGRVHEADADLSRLRSRQMDLSELESEPLGEVELARRNWLAAERAFTAAMEGPDAYLLARRAVALREQEKLRPALAEFAAALKLNPSMPGAWSGRVALLRLLGNDWEADTVLDDAIAANPESASLRYERLVRLAQAGHVEESMADVDVALRGAGHDPTRRLKLAAYLFLWQRQPGRGSTAKALLDALPPGQASEWPAPAVEFLQGRRDADSLRRSASSETALSEATLILAWHQLLDGEGDGALRMLQEVITGSPQDSLESAIARYLMGGPAKAASVPKLNP